MNVSIHKGERVAVLGRNGAGKSTFFLLCNGVLEHCLSRTEWARDESCSALHDGVEGVNGAHACLKELEWSWLLLVVGHGKLDRPALDHVDLYLCAVSLGEDGYGVVDLVCTLGDDALDDGCALHLEGSHDFELL